MIVRYSCIDILVLLIKIFVLTVLVNFNNAYSIKGCMCFGWVNTVSLVADLRMESKDVTTILRI